MTKDKKSNNHKNFSNEDGIEGTVSETGITVDLREISVLGSQIYKTFPGIPDFNPDDLVGKKGLEIYSKMRTDDQIKAVLTMKKFARLTTPWEIISASQDRIDIEKANFIKDNLDLMEGTFEDCLMNILTALDFGFSISELVWKLIENGKWAGNIGLKSIKTREPFWYAFDSDEHGNLRNDGIILVGGLLVDIKDASKANRFDKNKFVIYSYNKEFSNWYGRSDLRSAYRSYWSKDILIRFHNIYMERFGMPTHVGTYPKGLNRTGRDEFKAVLDKVQSKYAITMPEGFKLDLLQASANENGFQNAIEMHNKFIARSILIPDLLGYTTSSSGGAYALGKKHFDVFLWVLKKLGRDIEESIVGEQIIKRLIDLNYQDTERYPKFQFESITEEGAVTKAQIIQMGVGAGFINPEEEWVRPYLSLPKSDPKHRLGMPFPLPGQGIPKTRKIDETPGDGSIQEEEDDETTEFRIQMMAEGSKMVETIENTFVGQFSRCIYPSCGSGKIFVYRKDEFDTNFLKCLDCRNVFAVTKENEIYKFDKVLRQWYRERMTYRPSYFSKTDGYTDGYVEKITNEIVPIISNQTETVEKQVSNAFSKDSKNTDNFNIHVEGSDMKRNLELQLVRFRTLSIAPSEMKTEDFKECERIAYEIVGEIRNRLKNEIKIIMKKEIKNRITGFGKEEDFKKLFSNMFSEMVPNIVSSAILEKTRNFIMEKKNNG